MNIGIFGLGYVGLTTAACLLLKNMRVVGYEISKEKRDSLKSGICPLSEPGVEQVISGGIKNGMMKVHECIEPSSVPDVFLICVGTPSDERGATCLLAVDGVFAHLNENLELLIQSQAEVILRSTVPPGTLAALRKKYPILFSKIPVAFYPEFLREGTAIADFESPPQTVLGKLIDTPESPKICQLFDLFQFDYTIVDAVSAESLKFACNAFHALKVCFANEIGRMVSSLGGDAKEVMNLFIRDTSLNVSSKYLMPGAPYGGSCLPKDTRSIRNISEQLGLQLTTISSCQDSNKAHFNYIINAILRRSPKCVVILGLAFKRSTDDIRESPSLELIYRLLALGGIKLVVHDFLVKESTAVGLNRKLMSSLISTEGVCFTKDLEESLANKGLVVIMHGDERYYDCVRRSKANFLDVANWSKM